MSVLTYPKFQAPDINGVNLSGGKVNFYIVGTSTRKDTWTDSGKGTLNTNPVVLDSRGEADIYIEGTYKVVLTDENDVEIWTESDYPICSDYCLKDYKEVVATNATATGTVSLDLNDGNIHEVTLTGNTTFTFDNPVASGKASNLTITLSQDSHGSHTTTWPSSIKWVGGTAPTLTTTASAVDVLTFYTMDNGTTWYGFLSGADMS